MAKSEYRSAWCGQEPVNHAKCGGVTGKCQCPCHAINQITKPKSKED